MTIRRKLIIANVIVFGIILAAVAVVVYDRTYEAEIARIDSHLDTYAAGFVTEFEDEWENGEFPDNDDIASLAVPQMTDIRIQLIDSSGSIQYRQGILPQPSRDLVAAALSGRSFHQTIMIDHEPFRSSAQPVETDDKITFVLLLVTPAEEFEDRMDNLTMLLTITVLAALMLSGLAVYYFTGRAFRPVTQMIEAAEEISAATLDRRLLVPPSHNEVSRLAEVLNAMMARIEQSFRSQRRFVADASHELRTPLTVVYGELEFLKRRVDNGNLGESISTVLHEVNRLAHLVDQLLVLARLDASQLILDPRPVRLDELLAEVVRLLQTTAAERRIGIQLQIDEVVEASGNPDYLRRAVLNVVDNAVKYSPEGADVTILLRHERTYALVAVSDHGPGIKPAEIEQVFQRFYRSPLVRRTSEGSGLGLAIARELVEAHGGTVRIAATGKDGTTVEIRVPALASDDLIDPDQS